MSENQKEQRNIMGENVHEILAKSHFSLIFLLILVMALDMVFPIRIFNPIFSTVGWVLGALGTALAFWAQWVTHKTRKERGEKDSVSHRSFSYGPYAYLRHPTNMGLTMIMLSFSMITNSLFLFLGVLVYIILNEFIFIRQEENALEKQFGEHYTNYKKKVRKWF